MATISKGDQAKPLCMAILKLALWEGEQNV